MSLFLKDKLVSIHTVTFLSVSVFYVWMTVYALLVFRQFQWYEILSVSFVFVVIFFILTVLFQGDFFRKKLHFNIYNTLLSFIVSFVMVVMANDINPAFLSYVRTFPLLEAEMGLGWHQDTVYHVSVIQSILHFGYPSIAQHGTPFMAYHVLSHYVDAGIVLLTGVEVFDSYGLLFNFKVALFIISIVVFLNKTVDERKPQIFLLVVLLVAPAMLGTWHAIGSHGLWFISVLLIFSSSNVFKLLVKEKTNSLQDFIFVFLLVVVIALGKISTGFMYATFLGFYLFLKQPGNIRVYILGVFWVTFFFFYQKLMSPVSTSITLSEFEFYSVVKFLTHSPHYSHVLVSVYASLFLLMMLAMVFKKEENLRMLISAFASVVVLILVTNIKVLSQPDIFYFKYGLSSILILFSLQMLFRNANFCHDKSFLKIINFDNKRVKVLMLFGGVLLSSMYYKQALNVFNMGIDKLPGAYIATPFAKVNEKLDKSSEVSYEKILRYPLEDILPVYGNMSLAGFRDDLNVFLDVNGLQKDEALLFISKEVFEKDIVKYKGHAWARGMFVYAVTGVPMLYGIKEMRPSYGYAGYSEDSLWKSGLEFNVKDICYSHPSKSVISTSGINNPRFSIYKCPHASII